MNESEEQSEENNDYVEKLNNEMEQSKLEDIYKNISPKKTETPPKSPVHENTENNIFGITEIDNLHVINNDNTIPSIPKPVESDTIIDDIFNDDNKVEDNEKVIKDSDIEDEKEKEKEDNRNSSSDSLSDIMKELDISIPDDIKNSSDVNIDFDDIEKQLDFELDNL